MTATRSTCRSSARIARIWSPSTRLPAGVDREHAVAVSVEGDAEVVAAVDDDALEQREIGRSAADVDVLAVGVGADRKDLGAEPLERLRRDAGVGAVRAVDGDAQAGEVASEALDDVLEVAVRRDADPVDLPSGLTRRRLEQRLDLLLGGVGQLAALGVEELDAVVLGRVVRGRDDSAQVEREQRDGRGRQHAGEDGVAARRSDAPRERLLELGPRAARVAPDEDAPASGPERRRAAEPLDEVRGQVLVRPTPPNAVGAEVPSWPRARGDLDPRATARV